MILDIVLVISILRRVLRSYTIVTRNVAISYISISIACTRKSIKPESLEYSVWAREVILLLKLILTLVVILGAPELDTLKNPSRATIRDSRVHSKETSTIRVKRPNKGIRSIVAISNLERE